MSSECQRIADQLRRAFSGDAWHGAPVEQILAGTTAGQAMERPIPAAHNIWEIVLHIALYLHVAQEAALGVPMPRLGGPDEDWPPVGTGSSVWPGPVADMLVKSEQLAQTIEAFSGDRLEEIVPGRPYNFYFLFHGIVQHSLYHAGQIALLRKGLVSS